MQMEFQVELPIVAWNGFFAQFATSFSPRSPTLELKGISRLSQSLAYEKSTCPSRRSWYTATVGTTSRTVAASILAASAKTRPRTLCRGRIITTEEILRVIRRVVRELKSRFSFCIFGSLYWRSFASSSDHKSVSAFLLYLQFVINCMFADYTTNSNLSRRLDLFSADHSANAKSTDEALDALDRSHARLRGRVEGVAGDVGALGRDLDRLGGAVRGEVTQKLDDVRRTLSDALKRVGKSVEEIRRDVERGIVNNQ